MHQDTLRAGVAIVLATVSVAAEQPDRSADLAAVLQRAGERVEQYFARAQSLVCLETVRWQPLGSGLAPAGFGRNIESELRLSWDPSAATTSPLEAKTLRQLLKVNGHPPRGKDPDSCTAPEQHDTETQPLSMLLPSQRSEFAFALAGPGRVDRRAAIMIDFTLVAKASVDVQLVNGNENCVSFSLNGGMHGRIWLDADTYDVLRLDQGLNGLVDLPLPKAVARRHGGPSVWTMERLDSSIRFKPVVFQDPDETLILPISMSSLQIIRGAGASRLRTSTDYSRYRRFLTGGRIVKD